MLDYVKRILIVVAIAVFISILFVGAATTYAKTIEEDLINSLIWPTTGDLSDHYGTRGGRHYGIDIAAPEGTPIVSIKEGTITKSYYSDSYGNVIFVSHDNKLETVYAHLHERFVSEGERVEKGQVIGTVGNTGRSSGNHLHFEVHVGEWNISKTNSIDPLLVLKDEQNSLVAKEDDEKRQQEEFQTVLSARYQLLEENEEVKENFTYLDSVKTKKAPNRKMNSQDMKLTITVEKGDTLWSLAQKHDVTVEHLKEWNDLEDELIHVDQNLDFFSQVNELIHVVQPGETLHRIASEYEISIATIKGKNELNSDIIYPGDVLQVTN
ncbi:peptidoglycan DD-metalloendopeptidase family protein [Alkalihalobacterium alkalinitrilicum]|uniref:peptidoglycan DD-metalloendopeptidase family protein n=1 Tax=Alkalihalobacterium alkalinitrilicum TaxID=427920 RepID=UPI000994C048|nr:M23 family metallopeptidase [Alkalihalobacterium alkalinitrilicum]